MTRSRKVLCLFYFAVSAVALVACWRENLSYAPAGLFVGLSDFLRDLRLTAASRSIANDISLFFLSAAVWMVSEAKRLKMRGAGLYILFGFIIAISVTFPLFLIARERALDRAVA